MLKLLRFLAQFFLQHVILICIAVTSRLMNVHMKLFFLSVVDLDTFLH